MRHSTREPVARAETRIWAALLLVLAASPLTAPFSSCSIWDLLAGADVQAGAILQVKPAKDDPTASPGAEPLRPVRQSRTEPFSALSPILAVQPRILQIPLRL